MTDARILRTRASLHKAVLDLAHTKPVGEVTVSELAEHAEINRVTFYKHYTTPGEALAEALEAMLVQDCQNASANTADLDPFNLCVDSILDHLTEYHDLYTIAFNDRIDGTIPMMLVRHLRKVTEVYLTKRRKRKPSIPDVDIDVAAAFFAAGAMGAIHVWVLEGDMSRERFLENMSRFLPDWFFAEDAQN